MSEGVDGVLVGAVGGFEGSGWAWFGEVCVTSLHGSRTRSKSSLYSWAPPCANAISPRSRPAMIRRTTGYDTGGQPRSAAIPLTARCTSAALGGGLRSAIPSISSIISCGNRRPPRSARSKRRRPSRPFA